MPRAGTTFVYHALARHPGIFVPFRKELRYFSQNYHHGPDWYWHFFKSARPGQVCADVSPEYFLYPQSIERLQSLTPLPKVVLIVRTAADWAVSLHRQIATIERQVPAFGDFLTQGIYPHFRFGKTAGHPASMARFSLASGFIRQQLEFCQQALQERLLLCDFHLIKRDPLFLLQGIERFCGIEPHFTTGDLPDAPINAANRRQATWLNYILSRDSVVNMAGKLIPHDFLRSIRIKMDRYSSSRRPPPQSSSDAADLSLAKNVLAEDQAYIDRLFMSAPLTMGNGLPLPIGTPRK